MEKVLLCSMETGEAGSQLDIFNNRSTQEFNVNILGS